ncbi:hypothetical protein KDA_30910 [Dictyobacter alpinus]|uniref:Uncharacterized protein n=1 Tax=Dictyobacter alpinus TaxID=2014873 RepID=A0A402B8G1_9CHLR|nr:hypothetical protein [Dictyobacter alpinus]GCE27607.1 hypothetical protein KDA_30910 [Dictyobacter alpinus]
MSANQPQLTPSQQESMNSFAKIVKERYSFLYEQILAGNSSPLLSNVAARLDMSEDMIIDGVVAYETGKILRDVEMDSSSMKKLMKMVEGMNYSA